MACRPAKGFALSSQQGRAASAPTEPRFVMVGGSRLDGTVPVSGSKNAALALLAGTLLASNGVTVLRNLPRISDIRTMASILREMGARLTFSDEESTATVDATHLSTHEAPADLVARLRGSFFVLGPVLGRLQKARVAQPGGCNIGARSIDLHIKGLQAIGTEFNFDHGSVNAEAGPNGLRGASVYLDLPSVGATMNILMAAALGEGLTIIENAAQEPDVEDLGNLVNAMGGRVRGHGTGTLIVEGVRSLRGCEYSVMPDRIEAGTLALAAGVTGGDLFLRGANASHLRPVILKMLEVGMTVEEDASGVRVRGAGAGQRLKPTRLVASPHPGFPTDLQQPFTTLLCTADGTSIVTDKVYESRFRYLTELRKMGAQAEGEGRTAVVTGVPRLTGSDVEATDLRAGAALVLAGLGAEGQTRVFKTEHLERGYESLPAKLRAVGANIWREDEFGRRLDEKDAAFTGAAHTAGRNA